jgi:hypothetical protein
MRKRLSYANVTATLALVFAMSGGALAANSYLINSTKQINPKVLKKLTGKPGKNGAAGANGANGAAGATGPQGPKGAEGPKGSEGPKGDEGKEGAKGTNGATNVVVHVAETKTSTHGDGFAQANCNAGERATGGGVQMGPGNSVDVWYFQPGGRPSLSGNTGQELKDGETPTAWYASWYNESSSEDTFHVYVICAAP